MAEISHMRYRTVFDQNVKRLSFPESGSHCAGHDIWNLGTRQKVELSATVFAISRLSIFSFLFVVTRYFCLYICIQHRRDVYVRLSVRSLVVVMLIIYIHSTYPVGQLFWPTSQQTSKPTFRIRKLACLLACLLSRHYMPATPYYFLS